MKLIPIGPNQTELSFLASGKSVNLFFSYQTPVAAMIDGTYSMDKDGNAPWKGKTKCVLLSY